MCGIFGIYGENKRTAWDLYDKFKNVMHDRGPDSFNPLEYGSLSLLHSRLAIIDLSSGGNQPFKNERYAFAYNGELLDELVDMFVQDVPPTGTYLDLNHKTSG